MIDLTALAKGSPYPLEDWERAERLLLGANLSRESTDDALRVASTWRLHPRKVAMGLLQLRETFGRGTA